MSSDKDLGSTISVVRTIKEQRYSDDTTDINGQGVDTVPSQQQYHSVVFSVGKNGGNASDDLTFTVQESSDDGSSDAYSDLNDASGNTLTVQLTGADTQKELDITDLTHERYLRLKLKSGDATLGGTNTDVSAHAVRGGAKFEPV